MRAELLEQVFIERASGAFTLLLVLESAAGSRERVTLSAPGVDEHAAVAFLASYLRQNGLRLARQLRVRRRRAGELVDAPDLVARLQAAIGAVEVEPRYGQWD